MKLIFDPETGFNNSIVTAVIERVVCDDGFDDLIITTMETADDSDSKAWMMRYLHLLLQSVSCHKATVGLAPVSQQKVALLVKIK